MHRILHLSIWRWLNRYHARDKEVEIHGCFLGKHYFEKAARIIESNILPLDVIATHELPLDRYQEGLDLLTSGQALKVVVYPTEY